MLDDSTRAKMGRRWGWVARLSVGWLLIVLLALLALTACGGSGSSNSKADFGDQKNHIHSMLALPGQPGTLLVATHYGLFRTTDGGQNWQEVMGGSGQLAEGLMTLNLTVSPVNLQRIYVEAITFPDLPKSSGIPGIYTSTDGGATWQLTGTLSNLPSPSVYYMVAGARDEKQLYVYFQTLQAQGLFESMDAGAHWQQLGMLPDNISQGLIVDPASAGHLFFYSGNAGLFASSDDGAHWQAAPGIKDGIFKAMLAGPMLYATGDDGTFVSRDGGAHFTLTASNRQFSYLGSSTANPTTAFGLTGTQLFVTTDGGQTWNPLTIPPSHLLAPNLAVEPDNGKMIYLGNSYPVAVYASSNGGQQWSQIAPQS